MNNELNDKLTKKERNYIYPMIKNRYYIYIWSDTVGYWDGDNILKVSLKSTIKNLQRKGYVARFGSRWHSTQKLKDLECTNCHDGYIYHSMTDEISHECPICEGTRINLTKADSK